MPPCSYIASCLSILKDVGIAHFTSYDLSIPFIEVQEVRSLSIPWVEFKISPHSSFMSTEYRWPFQSAEMMCVDITWLSMSFHRQQINLVDCSREEGSSARRLKAHPSAHHCFKICSSSENHNAARYSRVPGSGWTQTLRQYYVLASNSCMAHLSLLSQLPLLEKLLFSHLLPRQTEIADVQQKFEPAMIPFHMSD